KKTAETPPSVNSSQVAERTMFCDTTTAMAHSPVKEATAQKRNVCRVIIYPLVPTLCVGMPARTLRVKSQQVVQDRILLPGRDAERPGRRSHAERGNEGAEGQGFGATRAGGGAGGFQPARVPPRGE